MIEYSEKRMETLLSVLHTFNNSHMNYLLVRSSISAFRATHVLRTIPSWFSSTLSCQDIEDILRECFERLVGLRLSNTSELEELPCSISTFTSSSWSKLASKCRRVSPLPFEGLKLSEEIQSRWSRRELRLVSKYQFCQVQKVLKICPISVTFICQYDFPPRFGCHVVCR